MNIATPAANTHFRPNVAALDHLGALEAESVYILREVAGQLERPVLLFSGGKDSAVLLRLSEKAFRPGPFPFPVLHVDTGHNFPEVLDFRDRRMAELGERLIVRRVQDSIDRGRASDPAGGAGDTTDNRGGDVSGTALLGFTDTHAADRGPQANPLNTADNL